jgi:hypothetical protein
MATPILNEISQDLAYKLQDPVASATLDGVRLTAAERLNYIKRGYRRLLRLVTLLYPDLETKLIQKHYDHSDELTSTSDGYIPTSTLDFSEVYEVYCKEPAGEKYQKAVWISPENYQQVRDGQNSFYTPSLDSESYYWTVIGDQIEILPNATYKAKATYRANILGDLSYNGSTDLDINPEFTDMLLTLSCAEAYLDIGQFEMYNAYRQDANDGLNILIRVDQTKEKKDETNEA